MTTTTTAERTIVLQAAKATIYHRGMISMSRMEVRDLRVEMGPYAQYAQAVHITFIPKGARSRRGFVETSFPSTVVLEGWGHVEPASMYPEAAPCAMTVQSRYSARDPRCQSDFDTLLAGYVERTGAKVVGDYRKHNPGSR